MRSQHGQAAVEYLALLAVVAALLVATVALVDLLSLSDTFGRTVSRGICIVRGGACDADLRPCVVAADHRSAERHVNLIAVGSGADRYLLRERRSDGTIALTDFRGHHLRAGGSRDGELRVGKLAIGGEVSLSLMARWGGGATYIARTEAEADRIERAIVADGPLPEPSERFGQRSTDREYGASASIGGLELAGAFRAGDRDGRRFAADGGETISYDHAEGWSAGVLGGGGDPDDAAVETYAVRLDPSGRPLELVVSSTRELVDAADLPTELLPVAVQLAGANGPRRVLEVEEHLDLGDPAMEAVALDFVERLRDRRPRVGAALEPAARLRRALREAGTIEARVHAVVVEERGAAGGIGIGTSVRRERSWLAAAASRSYDGRWRSREDCRPG